MLILGIETSTPRSSIALADDERVLATASLGKFQRHGEFVVPAIQFCLDQIQATPQDITGVAVGTGPGLFTGLRVGIATGQAFAAARDLPVVGLSGLDVLAFQTRNVRRRICVAIDARRKELFWAFYRSVPGGVTREGDPQVGTPAVLAAEIAASGEDCLVVGDGTRVAGQVLEDAGAELGGANLCWPSAEELTELAVPRFQREETIRAVQLQPSYLRQADAKIGWATRGRLHGGANA